MRMTRRQAIKGVSAFAAPAFIENTLVSSAKAAFEGERVQIGTLWIRG
jgi:hypothetical protein